MVLFDRNNDYKLAGVVNLGDLTEQDLPKTLKEKGLALFEIDPKESETYLKKQINEVVALMSVSDSKTDFIKLFNKRYNKNYQLEFDFANEVRDWKELSKFNKDLKRALDYNGK